MPERHVKQNFANFISAIAFTSGARFLIAPGLIDEIDFTTPQHLGQIHPMATQMNARRQFFGRDARTSSPIAVVFRGDYQMQ